MAICTMEIGTVARKSPTTSIAFIYQPQGWAKAHCLLALRYDKAAREKKNDKKKNKKTSDAKEAEQYQLFDTAPYERYHKKAWCPFVVRFEDGSESLFFSFELVAADKAAGQAG